MGVSCVGDLFSTSDSYLFIYAFIYLFYFYNHPSQSSDSWVAYNAITIKQLRQLKHPNNKCIKQHHKIDTK